MPLILVAAGAIVYNLAGNASLNIGRERAALMGHWVFGLGLIDFGLMHLTDIPTTASMIPKWLPLRADLWTVLTGIASLRARGHCNTLRNSGRSAARLLALMLLSFDALVLAPLPFASPRMTL